MNDPAIAVSGPRRLLAVNLNYLGDALFTTPALTALRAHFPRAVIDVLAGERAAAILAGNASVDRLVVRPPRGGGARAASLIATLRQEPYDAVILFQSILSNALIARASGVPVRVGFAQDGCGPFLSHAVPPRRPGEHVVAAYKRLAYALSGANASRAGGSLSIVLSPEDTAFADDFLRAHELAPPAVGLVLGATRPQKRWPEEYFARLADKLGKALGVTCVLLGGPEEMEAAWRVAGQARAATSLVSAVGRTSEKQLAALVARLNVVVSGDSGPLHIATAMGTPVVALFGSTDPAETGPWVGDGASVRGASSVLYDALSCAPCRKSPTCQGRFDCLRALTPERVFDVASAHLEAFPALTPRRAPLPMAATLAPTKTGTAR